MVEEGELVTVTTNHYKQSFKNAGTAIARVDFNMCQTWETEGERQCVELVYLLANRWTSSKSRSCWPEMV